MLCFFDVNLDDLCVVWVDVFKCVKFVQYYKIFCEELLVCEYMSLILCWLQNVCFMEFVDLFDMLCGVLVVVVNFIVMFEFVCELLFEIMQVELFVLIYVCFVYLFV